MNEVNIAATKRIKEDKILTGFSEFDHKTFGLYKSDVMLLVSRPSVGKSRLALNIASYVAQQSNDSVLIISTDKPTKSVRMELLNSMGLIKDREYRGVTKYTELEQHYINSSEGTFGTTIDMHFIYSKSIDALIRQIRAFTSDGFTPRLIVIDCLQSLFENEQEERLLDNVKDVVQRIKDIAVLLNVPIIITANQNRNGEHRECHYPVNTDLTFNNIIEPIVDTVAFLYRESIYDYGVSTHIADLVITKQRSGKQQSIKIQCQTAPLNFENLMPFHRETLL